MQGLLAQLGSSHTTSVARASQQLLSLVQCTCQQQLGSNGATDNLSRGGDFQPQQQHAQHCPQQLGPRCVGAAAGTHHQVPPGRPLHLLWGCPHTQQQQLQLRRHYRTKARPAVRQHGLREEEGSNAGSSELSSGSSDGYGERTRKGLWLRPSSRLQQQEEEEAVAAEELQQQWRQQWHQQQQRQLQQHDCSYRDTSSSSSSRQRGSRGWPTGDADDYNSSSRRDSNFSQGSSSSSRTSRYDRGGGMSREQQQQPTMPYQSSGGSFRPGRDPSSIERAIRAAGSLQELHKVVKQHRDHLQQDQISSAYQQVVKLATGHISRKAAARQAARSTSSSAEGVHDGSSDSSSSSGSSSSRMQEGGSVALNVMRQLNSRLLQQIRVARPWDLAQAVWACSKLHFRDVPVLEAIAQQAQRKAFILEPFDICQLASGYARLNFPQPQLLQLLSTQAIAKAAAFDQPWVLVHTAWALHTAGQDVRELLGVAVPLLRAPERLEQLRHLDMSSLLWLMAVHSLYDEELLQAAASCMAADIQAYSPASTANALMALAALRFSTPELTAAAAAAVMAGLQPQEEQEQQQQRQQQYRPKQAALSVFALSKLGACDRALLDAAAAAFRREAQAYSPPLLSMLVWAGVMAKQGLPEGFVQQLVQSSRTKLESFTGDQLASLLRGVLAMHSQHDSTMPVLLLSEAHNLLPPVLPDISTLVLSELIASLAQQLELQQQQEAERSLPEAALEQSSGGSSGGSSSGGSSSGSSSSGSSSHGVEQQQKVLQEMLAACVAEWCKAQRAEQLTLWHAGLVVKTLQGCGQDALADAAQQVAQNVQGAIAAAGQQQVKPPVHTAEALSPQETSAGAGGWMDSFVASTH